jgi:hypothetical protein
MSAPAPNTQGQTPVPGIGAWSGNRTGTFLDGSWGVRAKDGKIVLAWAVDMAVVLLVAAVAGTGLGKSSASVGAGVTVGILVWFLFPWAYGFCCVGGNTLGTLIAGTRLLKLRDGSGPGFWRSGWLMFLRTVLFLLMPLNAVLDAMNGMDTDSRRKYHVSIDKSETRQLHTGYPLQ